MTTWSDTQQNWAMTTENKEITGSFFWDLSAAFDTLDHEIMCRKLKTCEFDSNAISWKN
jgi:hypothetical protein